MATTSNSALMGQLLNQLLTESRITNTDICSVYDPKESINNWLAQFDLNAQRLGLDDQQKLIHIGHYLPMEISNWIARSPAVTTWPVLKNTLIQTYGIPAAKYKQIILKRLESLSQGTMSSRRFAVLFESVIFEFPVDDSLDTNTLRSIYLRVMSPKVRAMILPNIAGKLNWKAVSQAAVEIEECLSMNEDFLEIAFQQLTLSSPVQAAQPVSLAQQLDAEPMELDAMQHRNHYSDRNFSSSQNSQRPVHAIEHVSTSTPVSSTTVNYVNAIANNDYATIPIENDPLYTVPSINSIAVSASSATSTPRIKVILGKNQTVSALIDTGASLTVIRSAVVKRLGLAIDTSRTISFTTANNQTNVSGYGSNLGINW
ncbi:hypothetical protein BD770DRAFT_416949 [Pilaira anomala]|nr:hypothetical protein BD770DRAFT_416949 [Pilaira anomala]